jgi:phospholipid N-methyltransferase
MNAQKILGMIAAAESQLDALEFNPREFLAKLKKVADDNSLFESPAMNLYTSAGFSSPEKVSLTC